MELTQQQIDALAQMMFDSAAAVDADRDEDDIISVDELKSELADDPKMAQFFFEFARRAAVTPLSVS